MKSKYNPLVKLKKKELDRIEQELISTNSALTRASKELDDAYLILQSLSLPNSGTVNQFTQAQSIIRAQHYEIDHCTNKVAKAQQKQLHMQQQFKESMMDYEKFKYLELQEVQAHSVKTKREEAKMLDEIGVMTYKRELL